MIDASSLLHSGDLSYCESNTPLSLLTNANNYDHEAVPTIKAVRTIHRVDAAASTQAVEETLRP